MRLQPCGWPVVWLGRFSSGWAEGCFSSPREEVSERGRVKIFTQRPPRPGLKAPGPGGKLHPPERALCGGQKKQLQTDSPGGWADPRRGPGDHWPLCFSIASLYRGQTARPRVYRPGLLFPPSSLLLFFFFFFRKATGVLGEFSLTAWRTFLTRAPSSPCWAAQALGPRSGAFAWAETLPPRRGGCFSFSLSHRAGRGAHTPCQRAGDATEIETRSGRRTV